MEVVVDVKLWYKDGFVTITPEKTDSPKKQSVEIKVQFNPLLECDFVHSDYVHISQDSHFHRCHRRWLEVPDVLYWKHGRLCIQVWCKNHWRSKTRQRNCQFFCVGVCCLSTSGNDQQGICLDLLWSSHHRSVIIAMHISLHQSMIHQWTRSRWSWRVMHLFRVSHFLLLELSSFTLFRWVPFQHRQFRFKTTPRFRLGWSGRFRLFNKTCYLSSLKLLRSRARKWLTVFGSSI